jgi:ABC exporter DevB family membrane fusion protein
MKSLSWLAPIVLCVRWLKFLGCLALLIGCSTRPPTGPTAASGLPRQKYVTGQGRIEPYGGIIRLNAPPGDHVEMIYVEEGQAIHPDKELIRLASAAVRELEVQLAQAQLDGAKLRYPAIDRQTAAQVREAQTKRNRILADGPLDVEIFDKKIASLVTQTKFNEQYSQRLEQSRNSVSDQEIEKQKQATESTRSEWQVTQVQRRKAELDQHSAEIESAAQVEAVEASRIQALSNADLKPAELNLKLARAKLNQSIVRSPIAGVVLSVVARKGELTSGAPLLRVADLNELAVTAEIAESDMLKVKKGQSVEITIPGLEPAAPGLPPEVAGRVDQVSWLIAQGTLQDLNPAARVDRRVGQVKIKLRFDGDQEREAKVKRLINIQVDVKITVEK